MGSPKTNFYNFKSYWKRKAKQADKEVMVILNREVRGDLTLALVDYFELGHRILKLGTRGEVLIEKAVKFGMTTRVLRDLRDSVNLLEMYSMRVKAVAEKKWGKDLRTFPVYHTSVGATAELVSESETLQALQVVLGESDGPPR